MKAVLAILVATALAVETSPVQPQDLTTIAFENWCTNPLEADDFGPNGITSYFCRDFLRTILASGQGIELSIIVTQETWYSTDWILLEFMDARVRNNLMDFPYNAGCNYELKKFQACSTEFRPCNEVAGWEFESLGFCKETCEYLYPCIRESCTDFPAFDPDNITHCIITPAEADGSSLLAMLLALFLF